MFCCFVVTLDLGLFVGVLPSDRFAMSLRLCAALYGGSLKPLVYLYVLGGDFGCPCVRRLLGRGWMFYL